MGRHLKKAAPLTSGIPNHAKNGREPCSARQSRPFFVCFYKGGGIRAAALQGQGRGYKTRRSSIAS